MLLYGWTIIILYLYIINGRLEADVNKSVGSHCVLLKSSHHSFIIPKNANIYVNGLNTYKILKQW